MGNKKYKLKYLPLFFEDLDNIVNYIRDTLHKPRAADRLVDLVEEAIKKRQPFAESFEPFPSNRKRKYHYYRIYVENFIIYYVVIHEDNSSAIMEVRRMLYKKQRQDESL